MLSSSIETLAVIKYEHPAQDQDQDQDQDYLDSCSGRGWSTFLELCKADLCRLML